MFNFNSRLGSICLLLIFLEQQTTTTKAFMTPNSSPSTNSKNKITTSLSMSTTQPSDNPTPSSSRRAFLTSTTSILALSTTTFTTPASAVIMSNTSEEAKIFTLGKDPSKDLALQRFQQARTDLNYLLDHYDSIIAAGGGDNVRRYLGTVGVTSGMYGINKVLKVLQEEAEDIVEYTEQMDDFDRYLRAADMSCYSANFVEYSAAKTKPEKFFEDARVEAGNMVEAMDAMAKELKL